MGLPWVRLDANIATHDKILHLASDPSALRWQAAFSYVCALAWSGGHGTDGKIPAAALGIVHGNRRTARLLVKYGLWTEAQSGYSIVNFGARQELSAVAEAVRAAQSTGGKLGNCKRYHGESCWRNGKCSRETDRSTDRSTEPVERAGRPSRSTDRTDGRTDGLTKNPPHLPEITTSSVTPARAYPDKVAAARSTPERVQALVEAIDQETAHG